MESELKMAEAEQALRESEERFRTLADNIPQLAWMADPSGSIFWFNRRWFDYTGTDFEEMEGWGWQKVHHPDHLQRVVEEFRRSIEAGQVWEDTFPLRGKEGTYRWFLSRAIPIEDGNGRILRWLGTNTDITEQRAAEEAVRISEQQLRLLNQTLEQRVREGVAVAEQRAAQLRSLASELIQAEQRERRRLSNLLHDHLQQLLVATKIQLAALRRRVQDEALLSPLQQIDQLLDESIEESRSLTRELSPPILYDAGLAAGLEWLARRKQEKYGLKVRVAADAEAAPVDEETATLLFESVRELLFNVVKHAHTDCAEVAMQKCGADEVEIAVADHGSGFDLTTVEDDRDLDSFGLFSVRERLRAVGGCVEIQSAPGQGTRILLRAPRGKAALPPAEARQPAALLSEAIPSVVDILAGADRAARTVRVLLADDHAMIREGLAGLLAEQDDLEVVAQASNGQEAVELALRTHPDIAVLDITMPVLNGIEATRRIKAALPDVRVICLSMHREEEIATATRAAGAAGYLMKDGSSETLIEAIRQVLATGGPERNR
jgi:PAS domain S-box-containing protein